MKVLKKTENLKSELHNESESSNPLKSLRNRLNQAIHDLRAQIRGQEKVIEFSVAAFLAKGHLLLEGPPGVGKTTLARYLSQVFEGDFSRIQMTSDLLPGEILGILRPSADRTQFEFRKGPIFTNFLLADELNRTSPKTQAALLEAMAEKTVTVDGTTYPLPDPFFVVATQNPLESHGVYPLAESQLDRFMLQVNMELPAGQEEIEIYRKTIQKEKGSGSQKDLESIDPKNIFRSEEILELRRASQETYIESSVLEYIHSIIQQTRKEDGVSCGVSVRGGLQFISVLRALAFLRGRDFVSPQDILDLAVAGLSHRLRLEDGILETQSKQKIIQDILELIKIPH